jgi:DNA-binding LacI/PurR family transcriptional regulator
MDIQQVAKRAGVSTATVSRVINGSQKVRPATAERVRQVIAELNYVPNTSARNLRMGRSELFGLVVSDIKNPFFPALIDHFEELAATQGIDVIFTHTNYDRNRLATCMRRMVERNVDGIAVMTSEVDEPAIELATRRHIPVVLLNQPALESKYSTIRVEYSRGYREAIEHLTKLGHHDIAFLTGPSDLGSVVRREKAFQAAAKKYGVPLKKEFLLMGDMRVESGRSAIGKLLSLNPRPTALVTANDLMAVGAMQAAHSAGLRIPGDISIIGFDDLPIAAMMHPQLTTIHLSRREIAAGAFQQLVHLRHKKGSAAPLPDPKVHTHLIVRGSTAPPPSQSKS